MMDIEVFPEMSAIFNHVTRFIALEDLIRHEDVCEHRNLCFK